jgi:transmembrane sensor
MKKSNLDLLMHRYITNRVSEHERIKIEAWLNVMKAERKTDLELSKEDEERVFQKMTNNLDSVDDVIALYPRQSRLKLFFSNQWVQIAASVLVILSISLMVWNVIDKSESDEFIASGGKEKIILNDGTIVWLQEGSKLSYYQKEEGSRHAEFTGEALFEVAKDPNRTFTIGCGNIAVKVLGTSFNLKAGNEKIELKVLTGNVNLSSTEDQIGINVAPKEQVIYTTKGVVERIGLEAKDLSAITVNTEYNMRFSSTTMDMVIERIEKKFDVDVTVLDENLNKCRITADFTDSSLDRTLVMLTDLLDVTYQIDNKEVELSGKGCN